MKIKLNWALFLLTAASYVFYPVWHLPFSPAAQWALLNLFILLSAAVLYSPLDEVSLDASLPELKDLWPALLLAAAACLPFWLTPLPTGSDDQSHAGPPAWLLGRAAAALGIDAPLLPLFTLPAAAALGAAAYYLKGRLRAPSRAAAALALVAAGNAWFFASARFGLADAIGRYETVLRYPALSKFLYLPAYLLIGIREPAPRAVQFLFIALTAVYLLRLLKFLKASPPPRLTFLLVAFFPTFFNLSISAELEAGTVFFFTAAICHFIKAASGGDRAQFLKCAFWTAAGFFYKQLPLGLMLSFLPALAALWYIYPQRRPAWAYGLKTLLIPAAVGLPFIAISAALDIRNAALMLQNLLEPRLMFLNFVNLYDTAGPVLTGLLALSSGWAVYRRRGPELWLLLYLAAAYHVMISASAAVGYIRHAQPFYIAPVLLLALWAAHAARRFPALWAALLALLFFQSVFAKAPYQRKTAFNFREYAFPYGETAQYLRGLRRDGLKIYAPMEVEPSHFYLAKYGLAGRLTWDRTLPAVFTAATASKAFKDGAYDFMLLPCSPFPGVPVDFTGVSGQLKASGEFAVERLFDYGGNKLVLLKAAGSVN
ncbi:MAG TPA: hypothetical protein DEQ38_12140 [Elusimicrobia bacterium]|nr:MAG: hypothetical protein A2089_05570 [Elusimicrobia bacterium GWD2_63_28]HCC48848.1 hypothetical protein [Elusimicrobiota bacterium]